MYVKVESFADIIRGCIGYICVADVEIEVHEVNMFKSFVEVLLFHSSNNGKNCTEV